MSNCDNTKNTTTGSSIESIKRCACELKSDEVRIKCLVDSYQALMTFRRRPLTHAQLMSKRSARRLCDVRLANIDAQTTTAEFAESQILYTFIQQFIKIHPRFLIDGPDIGDIRLKTDFFSST